MKSKRNFESNIAAAEASAISRVVLSAYVQVVCWFPSFTRRLQILGDLASYSEWLRKSFDHSKITFSREKLWDDLRARISFGETWTAYEFGVAWGYTTNYWLSKPTPEIIKWHGFDRFTGLPRAWRDVEVGEFTANGVPPLLSDPRIEWHIGDVETKFQESVVLQDSAEHKIIFFDLDLYEPTAHAFRILKPHLKRGDILYFDEAYDADERRVLDELVLPQTNCRMIGSTYIAVALEIL